MSAIALENKTILVTGAAGFIGSNLVKRICEEVPSAKVVGIDSVNDYYDVALKEFRLNEHYTEKISLDELAVLFFINKYYLTKIFKETYGTTINSYIIAKRITRAKQMLRFTDKTLEEIAGSVGMNGGNYFSRMFKKIEGISPREYRKQW